jgi:outer membrane biosynthesis protein TonB
MRYLPICILTAGLWLFGTAPVPAEPKENASGKAPAANASPADATAAEDAPASASAAEPTPRLPREVHAGTLKAVERKEDPVEWVDLKNRLLADRFEPETDVPAEAVQQRPPAPGACYVIVTILLRDGRSISRYDYRLRVGDTAYPCLALSVAGRPFDVRQWRYALPGEVRLLFECPADAARADLEFALDTAVPQPAVRGIALREEPGAATAVGAAGTDESAPSTPKKNDVNAPNRPTPAPAKEKIVRNNKQKSPTKSAKPAPAEKKTGAKAEPKPPEKKAAPEKKKQEKDEGELFF